METETIMTENMTMVKPLLVDKAKMIINRIRRFYSGSQLKEAEPNLLKFSLAMSKLGIKKIYVAEGINDETIGEELSLYISPSYTNLNYTERRSNRTGFSKLREYIASLSGSTNMYDYCQLRPRTLETQEVLKIDYEGNKVDIGDYIRERNLIIICLPLDLYLFHNKENEYLDQLIKWIKSIFVSYKISEEDTSELTKRILLRRYMEVIEKNIRDKIHSLGEAESRIEEFKINLVKDYSNTTLFRLDIENLKRTRENLEEGLLKQIEEIKKLKFVKNVKFGDDGIKFEFEKIFIKVKDKEIEMGEYIITLTPSKIKIENKTPVIYEGTKYHSCHIRGETICFGEDGQTLAYELLGKMNLKRLAHYLYLYLKTYNPNDTHLSMNYWIKGKENGGEVKGGDTNSNDVYCDGCGDYVSDDFFNQDRGVCGNCS